MHRLAVPYSYHKFSFNCEFNRVSLICPDGEFNGDVSDDCCKVIGAGTVKLWIVIYWYVNFSSPKRQLTQQVLA